MHKKIIIMKAIRSCCHRLPARGATVPSGTWWAGAGAAPEGCRVALLGVSLPHPALGPRGWQGWPYTGGFCPRVALLSSQQRSRRAAVMEHSLLAPHCAQTEGNKRKKASSPGPATQHGITRSWCSGAPGAEPCGLCWHVGAGTQLRVPWAVPCLQQSPAGPRAPRPSSSGVLSSGGASLGAEAAPLPGALPCRPRRRRTRASIGAAFIIGLTPRQTPGRMRRGAAQRRHLPSLPPSLRPFVWASEPLSTP